MLCDVYYSPTHADMVARFLRPSCVRHGILLRENKAPVEPGGDWTSPGVVEMSMLNNAHLAYSRPCTGELRMLVGADVVFLRPIEQWAYEFMRNIDVAFADDAGMFCSDFMLYWDTPTVRQFFAWRALTVFLASQGNTQEGARNFAFVNDQHITTRAIKDGKLADIKSDLIPASVVVNWPYLSSQTEHLWEPGMRFSVHKDAYAFHANWTVGVDNKTKMLEQLDAETK